MRGISTSVVLLSLTLCTYGCGDNQKERSVKLFYPDGHLKAVATLKGNHMHGLATFYNSKGSIDSRSHWVNGKRTGVTCVYYSSGALKDSISFLNDTLHGPSVSYYRNGALKKVERYTNGTRTGIAVDFDSLGKRQQQFTYDRSGHEIYYLSYDADGEPAENLFSPITEAKDTIWWGEKYTGSIRYGYPLKGKVTMIVGVLGLDLKALDRWPIVDTFQVVPQSADGRFYFSYYPKRQGVNSLQYKFIQPESPWDASVRDSLTVDQRSVKHQFLVKKPLN
jgi:hypothetical protein